MGWEDGKAWGRVDGFGEEVGATRVFQTFWFSQ